MAVVSESTFYKAKIAPSYVSSSGYYGYVPPIANYENVHNQQELGRVGEANDHAVRSTTGGLLSWSFSGSMQQPFQHQQEIICFNGSAMETDEDDISRREYLRVSRCENNRCVIPEIEGRRLSGTNGNSENIYRVAEYDHINAAADRRRGNRKRNSTGDPAYLFTGHPANIYKKSRQGYQYSASGESEPINVDDQTSQLSHGVLTLNENIIQDTSNEASNADQDLGRCERNVENDISEHDSHVSDSYHSSHCSLTYTYETDDDLKDEESFDDDATNDSKSSDDRENCDSNKDFYENWIMFEASNVSVWEVFNMVQAISLRFKLSEQAQQSILDFAKVLAGPKFEELNTTKYSMAKIFNPPDDKMAYVFFCPKCKGIIHKPIKKCNMTDNKDAICSQCLEKYLLTRSSDNYFLSIDIEYQVRTILENPKTQRSIIENVHEMQQEIDEETTISDVYYSKRYKNCKYIRDKSNDNAIILSLNVNVDGAPLFNTSKKSLWPIQASINEIPAKTRFKHLILAGLLLTSAEPKPSLMNSYLHVFTKQILKLMKRGITVKCREGDYLTFYVTTFCFPVDTPARAIVQNRVQYNGYYGCSWCYALGEYIAGAMRYPLGLEEPPERNHTEYLLDISTHEAMRKTMKNSNNLSEREKRILSRKCRGSKGPSKLTSLSTVDGVWGFPSEYLHSVLLGAFKQQWEEWCNPKSNVFITPRQRALIDDRLTSIRPTSEIHRLPRLLRDRAKWRGSEWRSWGLFYSILCLNGILPDNILRSYMLLVRGVTTLLRTDITNDDLIQSEIDLIQYVGDCQSFYGRRFVTFNIHSVLHMSESVRQNGPLWATSAFAFESQMGHLKKVVTGPKGVVEQIVNRIVQLNSFKTRLSGLSLDTDSWRFCERVFCSRPLLKFYRRTAEGAVLAGIVHQHENESIERKYKRCIYNDVVFHSTAYTLPKTTCNTVVQLHTGTILEIQYFTVIDEICNLVGKKWHTVPFDNGVKLNHIRVVQAVVNNTVIEPITSVKQKLICISITRLQSSEEDTNLLYPADTQDLYVCVLPNTVEVQ